MCKSYFISGGKKKWFELKLSIRILFASIRRFGMFSGPVILRKYLKDKQSLFKHTPNRFLKTAMGIFAVPDMPPLNTKLFVEYVLRDMELVVRNGEPKLVFAIVCITSKCPYKCAYCYNSDMHTNNELLSFEKLSATISDLIDKGVHNIYLSGGEPMTRYEDLKKLLKLYGKTGTGFWLLTTGWQIIEAKLKELKSLGLRGVMISLDSYEPTRINQVKSDTKAFENAKSAIQAASTVGLISVTDTVFSKKLLKKEEFEKFVNFTGTIGAHFINCYTPRRMHHELDDDYLNFELDDFKRLAELTETNRTNSYNLPITYSPDAWESTRGCVGGKLFIYIDPQGNVRSCPFVQTTLANINEKTINQILEELKGFENDDVCPTMNKIKDLL